MTEDSKMNDIDFFLKSWSGKKTIKGQSFDELFEIEGIPLWWFLKRFFVAHVMPTQINAFQQMHNHEDLTVKDNLKNYMSSKILTRYISINEQHKIKHYGKNVTNTDTSNQEKALFITYSNHINNDNSVFRLQGVLDALQKDGRIKELVLFSEPLSKRRHKTATPYSHIYRYYDEAASAKAKECAEELSKKWRSLNDKDKYSMLSLRGTSLWPYLKHSFNLFMSKEFLYVLILQYEILKKIILQEEIKVIVLTSMNGLLDKCAMAAAKQFQTSCLIIQHGTGKFYDGQLANHEPIGNSKLLVFSDFYKKQFVDSGVAEDNVIVVGPVVLDEVVDELLTASAGLEDAQKKEKTILFATSPLVEDNLISKDAYFGRMAKILSDLKKIDGSVILKLHPREKHAGMYRKIMQDLGFKDIIILQNTTRKEFYGLMRGCVSFLNLGWTAAMEAIIFDKPVVTIDIQDNDKDYIQRLKATFIEDSNATLRVRHEENITEAVERSFLDEALFKQRRKEFVRKYFHTVDGKAHQRVVECVYGVMGVKR